MIGCGGGEVFGRLFFLVPSQPTILFEGCFGRFFIYGWLLFRLVFDEG